MIKNPNTQLFMQVFVRGERVAGFKDLHTGKFEEIMLIRNDSDLNEFMETYNILAEEIVKEW